MKLFSTPNFPFSRMARIAIHELNLSDQIEVEFVTVRDPESELSKYGPLGKVPALQINDNLFSESRIVISMLEAVAKSCRLTAANDESGVLAFEGFCIGFLESIAVACALDLANTRLGFNEYEKQKDLNEWLEKVKKRKSFQLTEPLPI